MEIKSDEKQFNSVNRVQLSIQEKANNIAQSTQVNTKSSNKEVKNLFQLDQLCIFN